ncbi:class I SAM-dependent methyltransferase [Patescibacteria group bacterium AH-259-L05]|nr:class I SAM-dependent methyltransferase [Patescibacteria group bacterium AH-259-L05]
MIFWIGLAIVVVILFNLLHWLSYHYLKNKILQSRRWDLNICCGKTDGGGVNADIVKHIDVPHFVLIKDIYHLPFKDKQFDSVLCSHTMEHANNPKAFFKELQRVGKDITIVIPPLWDIGAALYFFEHKWIYLSFRKKHKKLPRMIPYPLGILYNKIFGQVIKG